MRRYYGRKIPWMCIGLGCVSYSLYMVLVKCCMWNLSEVTFESRYNTDGQPRIRAIPDEDVQNKISQRHLPFINKMDSLDKKMDSPNTVKRILNSTRDTSVDYKAAMKVLNEARVDQEDPRLIQLIRDYYIDHPSSKEYYLEAPSTKDNSGGQVPIIDRLFDNQTSGFFVECGAFNGEYLSNSLYFERFRGWTGVLIEADPDKYRELRTKNRKAFSVNACLSTSPYPTEVTFNPADVFGRIIEDVDQKKWINGRELKNKSAIKMQCFPLVSILLALGQKNVDYFSLDIEGDELKVLKSVHWDKVDIRVMSIEVDHLKNWSRLLSDVLTPLGYKNRGFKKGKLMGDAFYQKK